MHIDYITECLAKDELLDPDEFALVDRVTEKKAGIKLKKTLERAATIGSAVLSLFVVALTHSSRSLRLMEVNVHCFADVSR